MYWLFVWFPTFAHSYFLCILNKIYVWKLRNLNEQQVIAFWFNWQYYVPLWIQNNLYSIYFCHLIRWSEPVPSPIYLVTLDSWIDIGQEINGGPGKGKKNKRRALNYSRTWKIWQNFEVFVMKNPKKTKFFCFLICTKFNKRRVF